MCVWWWWLLLLPFRRPFSPCTHSFPEFDFFFPCFSFSLFLCSSVSLFLSFSLSLFLSQYISHTHTHTHTLHRSKRQQVAESLPFPAIRYLAGECNYGGRVTDANDRRTLLTILEDFYNPTIIQDYKNENDKNEKNNYQFSVLSNQYSMPQMGWLQNHRDYIKEELPMMDDGPEMYGLHSNANISCALQETTALLETALSLQPQDSGNSGGDGASSWDEQVSTLASAIENRVPSNFLYDEPLVALKYPVAYEESMNTVLQQELLRFNGLLKIVHFTLVELQKAIKGLVLLSSDLYSLISESQTMFNTITKIQIPHIVPFQNIQIQKRYKELTKTLNEK